MKKTFFKSLVYSMIFILINIITNAAFIIIALRSIEKYGQYRFDFTWMIMFTLIFFGLIFNIHFAFMGTFSSVNVNDDNMIIRKLIKKERVIKWGNVSNIEVIQEMRHYIKTVEIPIIIIEAYDEVSKTDVTIKIDYRKKVHDAIISQINHNKKKTLDKMSKYFDRHP